MRYVPRGFVDMRDLVGVPEISDHEAHRRQRAGEVWIRPRPARKGLVPLTDHEILSRINAGTFPEPQQLGPGRRYWLRAEILRWLADQQS